MIHQHKEYLEHHWDVAAIYKKKQRPDHDIILNMYLILLAVYSIEPTTYISRMHKHVCTKHDYLNWKHRLKSNSIINWKHRQSHQTLKCFWVHCPLVSKLHRNLLHTHPYGPLSRDLEWHLGEVMTWERYIPSSISSVTQTACKHQYKQWTVLHHVMWFYVMSTNDNKH